VQLIDDVLSRASPAGFRERFMDWARSLVGSTGGEIIAVGGKTARGSGDHKNNRDPLHMVQYLGMRQPHVTGPDAA